MCVQRWLKQALEEEGSLSPGGRTLLIPAEGPLTPPINGDADSPITLNGTCPGNTHLKHQGALEPTTLMSHFNAETYHIESVFYCVFVLSELPTPLKKRRLCPLDSCVSDSSTPYTSPCATPTRPDPSDAPLTPQLLNTSPGPSTPTQNPAHTTPQEVNTPTHVCTHPHTPGHT